MQCVGCGVSHIRVGDRCKCVALMDRLHGGRGERTLGGQVIPLMLAELAGFFHIQAVYIVVLRTDLTGVDVDAR